MSTRFQDRRGNAVAVRFAGRAGRQVEVFCSEEEWQNTVSVSDEDTGAWFTRRQVEAGSTVRFWTATDWNRSARNFERWAESHSHWEESASGFATADAHREQARQSRNFQSV